jgi:hypothetical protein
MTIAPGALSRFQDDFTHALFAVGEAAPPTVAALIGQPAFAVYRNTVIKACIDALQANYPAVNRLVGDEWMRAAAAIYVGKTLPGLPMLLEYGADFAEFLASFEPAAELPYLQGVARLDRFWTEAHVAATEDPLDRASIARFAEGNFYRTRLQPHAAARWAWYTEAPIYTIWARNRSDAQFDTEIDWCAEGALLTRPGDAVTWRALDQAGCAFLDACAAGDTVAEATHAALHVDRNADLSRLITPLLDAGVFSRIRIDDR